MLTAKLDLIKDTYYVKRLFREIEARIISPAANSIGGDFLPLKNDEDVVFEKAIMSGQDGGIPNFPRLQSRQGRNGFVGRRQH